MSISISQTLSQISRSRDVGGRELRSRLSPLTSVAQLILLVSIISSAVTVSNAANYDVQGINDDLVKTHNVVRKAYKINRPIRYDPALQGQAEKRVQYQMSICDLSHDGHGNFGENLSMGTGQVPNLEIARRLQQLWINEAATFNPNKHDHFTQMIWAETTSMACAMGYSCKNVFLACSYYPPGNVITQTPYTNNPAPTDDSEPAKPVAPAPPAASNKNAQPVPVPQPPVVAQKPIVQQPSPAVNVPAVPVQQAQPPKQPTADPLADVGNVGYVPPASSLPASVSPALTTGLGYETKKLENETAGPILTIDVAALLAALRATPIGSSMEVAITGGAGALCATVAGYGVAAAVAAFVVYLV